MEMEALIGALLTILIGIISFIFKRQDSQVKKLREELLLLRIEDKRSIIDAHKRLDTMNDLVVRRSDFDKRMDLLRADIKELKNDISIRLDRIEKRNT